MTQEQLQALAALQRRFIHTTSAKWDEVVNAGNAKNYNDSIVFIYDENKKGTKIYTQGATFEMSNADDVKNIINQYLPGKGDGNIVIEYVPVDATKPDGDKKLVIKEKSTGKISDLYTVAVVDGKDVATIKETGSDSQLVQVSAVADALTTPVATTLSVANGVATFTESFENLKGETVTAVGSVLKAGDNVSLESDTTSPAGLKISATDTTYALGIESNAEENPTGVKVNLTSSTELDENEKPLVLSVEFVGGTNISVSKNADGEIEIASTYVAPEETVYKGEDAIVISNETVTGEDNVVTETGAKLVTLKIAEGEKILSQDDKGLKTSLFVKYDSKSNQVFLTNDNAETEYNKDSETIISSFDASVFVKDSFLKEAKFVTISGGKDGEVETGKADGDYIKFNFQMVETDADSTEDPADIEQVVYVPVTEFVKKGTITYTAAKTEGETTTPHSLTATTTNGTLADVTEVVNAIKDYTAGAIAELDSTVSAAATVEDENKQKVTPENTVDVITSITQVDGKLSTVSSANVATTTYVDNAVTAATPTGELSLTNTENGSDYVFAVAKDAEQNEKDGFVKASDLAAILNAAWGWGEIK